MYVYHNSLNRAPLSLGMRLYFALVRAWAERKAAQERAEIRRILAAHGAMLGCAQDRRSGWRTIRLPKAYQN